MFHILEQSRGVGYEGTALEKVVSGRFVTGVAVKPDNAAMLRGKDLPVEHRVSLEKSEFAAGKESAVRIAEITLPDDSNVHCITLFHALCADREFDLSELVRTVISKEIQLEEEPISPSVIQNDVYNQTIKNIYHALDQYGINPNGLQMSLTQALLYQSNSGYMIQVLGIGTNQIYATYFDPTLKRYTILPLVPFPFIGSENAVSGRATFMRGVINTGLTPVSATYPVEDIMKLSPDKECLLLATTDFFRLLPNLVARSSIPSSSAKKASENIIRREPDRLEEFNIPFLEILGRNNGRIQPEEIHAQLLSLYDSLNNAFRNKRGFDGADAAVLTLFLKHVVGV